MSPLVRFKSQNHPQQTTERGPRDLVDDRGTDPELFARLHERFGFTLDVAAAPHNAKLPRYFTRLADGLAQSWDGERVWCNPPYSDIRPWVEKANVEAYTGAELIVMLLPANRTEQAWWHDLIEHQRDGRKAGADFELSIEFLPGAVTEAWERKVNPGGQIALVQIPPEHVPAERFRNRLLTRAEAEEAGEK